MPSLKQDMSKTKITGPQVAKKTEENLMTGSQLYDADWSAVEAREAWGVEQDVKRMPHFCRTCRAVRCDGTCGYKQLMTERDELDEQLGEALANACSIRGTCGILEKEIKEKLNEAALEEKIMQSYHWHLITFSVPILNGVRQQEYLMSTLEKKLTKKTIELARKDFEKSYFCESGRPVVINCTYMGHMTREEMYG